MLGAAFAATKPRGRKKLVIANSPTDMKLWMKGIGSLLDKLLAEVTKKIRNCDVSGDFESKEYRDVMVELYKRHFCRVEPWQALEA